MRERLGFIGLGIMGRPMASHLLKAGYSLTVWNRSSGAVDQLVEQGARRATGPAGVARHSDVVFTMVGDSPGCGAGYPGSGRRVGRGPARIDHHRHDYHFAGSDPTDCG